MYDQPGNKFMGITLVFVLKTYKVSKTL